MRIAITSQNFKTITGHAGQTRRFIVYDVDSSGTTQEVDRLDLPKELTVHEYHGGDHPLFAQNIQALITQSAGAGFVQKLAQRGIVVHITGETDPIAAVTQISMGKQLMAATEHDHNCGCHHGH